MNFINSLSFRIFVLILVGLILVFSLTTYLNVHLQSEHLMDNVILSANRMSDVIKRSTRYSMLLNRRDDVYQIIKTVGDEPGVTAIRIYNKKGEIMFSTLPEEKGEVVNMQAEACVLCHEKSKPPESLTISNRTRIYYAPSGERLMGLINPIKNELDCTTADCHAHEPSKTILGVLDIKMSLAQVDQNLAESKRQLILLAIFMTFVFTTLTGWFIWRVIGVPVKKLRRGTKEISSGNLDYQIEIRSNDDMGRLAHSFNRMTMEVKKAQDEITEWNNKLEEKVKQKTEELKKVQDRIIQIEKMASLGKLSATVAHELNNPLAGILNYAKLIMKKLGKPDLTQETLQTIQEDLKFVVDETKRCGNIVRNLLLFSKKQVSEFSPQNISDILKKSVRLIQHHLEIQKINYEEKLSDPTCTVMCDPNLLEQAFIALFVNAVEAMPKGGTLRVESRCPVGTNEIEIRISDTGVGIPEDIQQNIFEPFFTTKHEGKGVGLGLSVVYGIVEQHNGQIKVESTVNRGTTFYLTLPKVTADYQNKQLPEGVVETV